jgi:histidinol-phosphate/aromatic aminotransferase/cobyric acid decarboxylase-like protein
MDRPELVSEHVSMVRAGRDYLNAEVKKLGLTMHPGFANFALVDVGGPERSAKICTSLAKEKIIIKGGFREPCMEQYIRIGLGSVDQMKCLMEKLTPVLKMFKAGS